MLYSSVSGCQVTGPSDPASAGGSVWSGHPGLHPSAYGFLLRNPHDRNIRFPSENMAPGSSFRSSGNTGPYCPRQIRTDQTKDQHKAQNPKPTDCAFLPDHNRFMHKVRYWCRVMLDTVLAVYFAIRFHKLPIISARMPVPIAYKSFVINAN